MAVNSGVCVWERTETDVMVTQKDTRSLRQSTPHSLAHRICLSLVVCFSGRCVRLQSWMTYGQWFNDKSLCVSVCVREMREYSLRQPHILRDKMTAVLIITIQLLEGRPLSLPERHTTALHLACPQKAFLFVCFDFENSDRIPCPLSHIHNSCGLFSSDNIMSELS